ncbi:MAG TPA: YndJ family protein [Pyrinomonadaceae bacterium]|nr:YndJ family protein [Pyrinomonadaceae bacterium]
MSTAIARIHETEWLRVFAQRSAAIGFVAWLLLILTTTTDSHETELIHKIVFFAMLVIVPLALSLVTAGDERGNAGLFRLVVIVQPLAAVLAIASFFFEKGIASAALSSAWLIFCAVTALFGLTRLVARGVLPVEEASVDAGLLYLPVAGMWLVIYRFGVQPFDYGETIILLTVVHFHFAGFAAPIIAGTVGRSLHRTHPPSKIYLMVVVLLVAAMPLIAAGITFSPWLGLIGTLILSTALVTLAVITLRRVFPVITSRTARSLLLLAALSSCTAMVLACLYAYSIVAKILILRIPTMAMTHGLLNAFGFTACSLLAWSMITRAAARPR